MARVKAEGSVCARVKGQEDDVHASASHCTWKEAAGYQAPLLFGYSYQVEVSRLSLCQTVRV